MHSVHCERGRRSSDIDCGPKRERFKRSLECQIAHRVALKRYDKEVSSAAINSFIRWEKKTAWLNLPHLVSFLRTTSRPGNCNQKSTLLNCFYIVLYA